MAHYISHGDTLVNICCKHTGDQILSVQFDVLRHIEPSYGYFAQEGKTIVVVERQLGGQESVEDDTARPDVRG